jgi:hypothetical protein
MGIDEPELTVPESMGIDEPEFIDPESMGIDEPEFIDPDDHGQIIDPIRDDLNFDRSIDDVLDEIEVIDSVYDQTGFTPQKDGFQLSDKRGLKIEQKIFTSLKGSELEAFKYFSLIEYCIKQNLKPEQVEIQKI